MGIALVLAVLSSIGAQSPANIPLREAHLPDAMKNELAAVVIAAMVDASDLNPTDQKRIAFDSQVSFLPLRHGALPAILIEPSDEGSTQLCAPNGDGNCPFWLFQQSKGHAALLLEDDGENFFAAKTSHNGMRDLVIIEREGHTPIDEVTTELHFDGKAYSPAICSESITGGDENDTEVRVPPHPCKTPGHRVVLH